jgi:hypothetical protein
LDAIFDPVTEIVNIADEVPANGLILSDRVQIWLDTSDRHVYIGRGSKWGNEFSHLETSAAKTKVATREEAIVKYREHFPPELLAQLDELEGKRLGCWCKPKACHGDVLVELIWLRRRSN